MTEDELKLLRALRDGVANDHQVLLDKLIAGFERGPMATLSEHGEIFHPEELYAPPGVNLYCFEVQS